LQSVEGGFIFTNDRKEYEWFLMARNHGMTRSLTSYKIDNDTYFNRDINSSFDFYDLGYNFRNTDINAYIGLLDFKKIQKSNEHRKFLYNTLYSLLIGNESIGIIKHNDKDVPFCIPLFVKRGVDGNKKILENIFNYLRKNNIEYRPIVSGFLGKQTCYKKYFENENMDDFTNSLFIHENGFYIGLHFGVTIKQIERLAEFLNDFA
jgi:CDP-6-deoxy-D-xylo-4-hexulose-3-dehydrase